MKYFPFLLLLFATNIIVAQSTYKVDPKKSIIEWVGNKISGSHSGTIELKEGNITTQKDVVQHANFIIDMTTIKCLDIEDKESNQKLVSHLESPDFFNVKKYNTSKLEIKEVSKTDDGQYLFKGTLTIKGITNPIEFPADIKLNGDSLLGNATFSVDRSKYDVRYGSSSFFDALGNKVIYDDMDFTVKIVAIK